MKSLNEKAGLSLYMTLCFLGVTDFSVFVLRLCNSLGKFLFSHMFDEFVVSTLNFFRLQQAQKNPNL